MFVLVGPMRSGWAAAGTAQLESYLPVHAVDPTSVQHINEKSLQALFSLTNSEAKLVVELTRTGSLKKAAAACKLTNGSGRVYLKRIFEKTNTRSQVELVTLVLSSLPF